MGSIGSAVSGAVGSWFKKPVQNFATGGLYGVGQQLTGPGGFLSGPGKLGSGGQFKLTKEAEQAEKEALKRLSLQAQGKGPSISALQYKQALDDMKKAQQSSVASARGAANPMLLQRQALQMGQQAGIDIARESAAAKLAERRSAEQAILAQAAAQRGVALNAAQTNLMAQQQKYGTQMGMIGNLAATGGLLLAASDENLKKNVEKSNKSGNDMIEDFLNALKSYTYEYKEKEINGKKTPDGKVTSVMAQDLEKSDLGKQMVKDTPEGKMVDYAQGMAPLFAAIAELNARTKKLEKKG